jgi:hypothetical protein
VYLFQSRVVIDMFKDMRGDHDIEGSGRLINFLYIKNKVAGTFSRVGGDVGLGERSDGFLNKGFRRKVQYGLAPNPLLVSRSPKR